MNHLQDYIRNYHPFPHPGMQPFPSLFLDFFNLHQVLLFLTSLLLGKSTAHFPVFLLSPVPALGSSGSLPWKEMSLTNPSSGSWKSSPILGAAFAGCSGVEILGLFCFWFGLSVVCPWELPSGSHLMWGSFHPPPF